jgi:NAD-dependent SIR2 family protein deacetylase
MHPRAYPTRLGTPEPPAGPPALHLLGNIWTASCPTCGFQLTTARTQERCERRARRKSCPVCHQDSQP